MLLSKPQNDLTSDVNSMPYILHKLDKDGTLLTGPPGLEVYMIIKLKKLLHARPHSPISIKSDC